MKKKILLSAYSCEPNRGSESEVGWNWAIHLADMGNEIFVITRLNQKKNIDYYLSQNLTTNINFIYYDLPNWLIKILKGKSNSFTYLYFYLWQIGIYFKALKITKKIDFDFIHHVTLVSYRFPSLLCLLNIPFIYGPISGGEEIPCELKKNFNLRSKFLEFIRELNNKLIKYSPLVNLTFKKSLKIIVTSEATKNKIPKKYHHKVLVELAISLDKKKLSKINEIASLDNKHFLFCYAGVLEHRKGINILLKIINKLKQNNYNFIFSFFGDGILRLYIKKYILDNNLSNSVKLFGNLNQLKLHEEMGKNQLLLFPSLRDSGGLILLEAMSIGLPSAILNLAGPSEIITNDCGIVIDVLNKNEDEIVDEFYIEIEKLIIDKKRLTKMSQNCLLRIKNFSLNNKINKIYNFDL
jgi:glycosyltransferase involved in cell wall biosynthesis